MGEISSNAGRVDDIVEGELVDKRAGLQEEGEGLSNASSGSENNYLDPASASDETEAEPHIRATHQP